MVNGFSLVSGGPLSLNLRKKKSQDSLPPETKEKKEPNTLHKAFYESVMIQPQVHLRLPCYDFYFL